MKTFIVAVVAVAAVGAALPAAAQGFGPGFGPGPARFDSRGLQFRIERAEREGRLSPARARDLEYRLADLRRVEFRSARDGFVDGREARALDRRYAALDAELARAIRFDAYRDRDYRFGYGWR